MSKKGPAKIKLHDHFFKPLIKMCPEWITPNHLSALRFFLFTPLILLMYFHYFKLTGGIFIGAAVLDGLDGSMARLRSQETKLGAFLDPAADKAVNFVVFLGFLFYIKSNYYLYLIMLILAIDVLLFGTALIKFLIKDVLSANHWLCQKIEVRKVGANKFGKIKMVLQVIVLSFLLLFDPKTSIKIHAALVFLPKQLTLLHLSFPFLIACLAFGLLSLYGHLQVIDFKKV